MTRENEVLDKTLNRLRRENSGTGLPGPVDPDLEATSTDAEPEEISSSAIELIDEPEQSIRHFDPDGSRSASVPQSPTERFRAQRALGLNPARLPWLLLLLLLLGVVWALFEVGLPMKRALEEATSELGVLQKRAAGVETRAEELEKERAELVSEREKLKEELEKKRRELESLAEAETTLRKRLENELKQGQVRIHQAKGQLVVDLENKILFTSGEATLDEEGKKVLRQVGETFLAYKNKVIQVGGHTDATPISPKLEATFPSNWELSSARAINVVRFLQDECKIPGKRLMGSAHAAFRPVARNDTPQGRRRNRRIEVVLLPAR